MNHAQLAILLLIATPGLLHAAEPTDIFQANRRLGGGVNIGNYLEVPRGQSWGISIDDGHFDVIKQAGFANVRLPVRWPDHADDAPPFKIEESFFARVDHLLDQTERVGLNVVMNIHHFQDLNTDPNANRQRFAALWKQIAKRYQDRPRSLYFELNNEPHDQLSEVWNDILLDGLAAIRETNPTRPVIIGPPHWNGIRALPELELPDDPNLIVTVHMYNPHKFTHQGASWVSEEVQQIKDLSWGTDEEIKAVEKEMADAAAWGKANHRPIYLGEFGAYSKAPMESRLKWTRTVKKAARKHDMSWSYWEFAAGFGIYDAKQKSWRQPLLDSLLPRSERR